MIMQGLNALRTLGTFNVLGIAVRGVQSQINNPIAYDDIITAGLKYLRRYPDSPAGPDVHMTIANAYMHKKNLAKAVYHFEHSGKVSEKKLLKLKEKAAKQYLDFAEAADDKEEKRRCYELILDRYPSTASSSAALKKLAQMEKSEQPLFKFDKKTIYANPILFKLTELNLSPILLDGDRENREISEKGIRSNRHGEITITYDGEEEQTVRIDYSNYKRLSALAEEMEYQRILEERRKQKLAGNFPVELRGTVGGDGVYVYPRLKVKAYEDQDEYLYK
jgi:hypothetical protein